MKTASESIQAQLTHLANALEAHITIAHFAFGRPGTEQGELGLQACETHLQHNHQARETHLQHNHQARETHLQHNHQLRETHLQHNHQERSIVRYLQNSEKYRLAAAC